MNNPVLNIIPSDLYSTLLSLNLLNKKTIRDMEIKRKYLHLRDAGIPATDAIDLVLQEYPYLQYDTLRKIIYSVRLPEESGMKQRYVA